MSENILTQIKSQYNFFTKVEKKIADLILDDPQKFVTYPTATVAMLSGVSQGSINNFAKKFTPQGFSFLKLAVARCVSIDENDNASGVDGRSGKVLKLMERRLRQDISALCNTLEINDEESLEKAAELINSAGKIEIFGVYQSGIVAKNFSFKLVQLGLPALNENDSLMFSLAAAMLGKNDVAVVISSSGATNDVLKAVKIAKSNGVKIVSITSNKFSPLAKLSDAVLLSTCGNGSRDGIIDRTRMSQLLIIDCLSDYIGRISGFSKEKNELLDSIINSYFFREE